MGSYLSEPVTEKHSTDETNDKLVYGASSMQGWRVSQEDAHNSILDYDENAAFFAVYDGHGGHEVAHYCAQKLPQFIKDTEAYKKGDIEQALVEGFLAFDATIATPEIVAILKEIAGEKEAEEDSDEEEENVNNLYEEASMPIEKVIEKYTNLVNPTLKNLKTGDKVPRSPMITAKKDSSVASASSSSCEAASSSKDSQEGGSDTAAVESSTSSTSKNEAVSSSTSTEVNGDDKKEEVKEEQADSTPTSNGPIPEIKITNADSSETVEAESAENEVSESTVKTEENITTNGNVATEKKEKEDNKDSVSSSVDGEVVSHKGKGKSPMKKVKTPARSTRSKRNATQLYKKLLDFQDESDDEDTEDEEDKTFVGPGDESSDEEGVAAPAEASGDDSSDGDDEAEEEDEEDEEMDDDEDELEFARNMKEEPGSDSGCTAVVALLKGRDLYVANAGDSRCIVCRNGKAVDMSFDHKPEDEPERNRIVKAGGKVTADGRVNGGLNLSRAIGDHAYKQNQEFDNRQQMITALPDIKKLTINPAEDEFMVLACDGIWNFMSSQEVVDFVKPRLEENSNKVSHICEEMFDHCLAPNTMGDGTGCDNMTAIIIRFKSNLKKRSMSPEPATASDAVTSDAKRAKTEEGETAKTSS